MSADKSIMDMLLQVSFTPEAVWKFWNYNLCKGYRDVENVFLVSETAFEEHKINFVLSLCFFTALYVLEYIIMQLIIRPAYFVS